MNELLRHRIGRLARNFLVLGTGSYGAMAVALAINAVLTRRLGVEQFGHLALLLMASQVMAMFAANWTYVGTIRFAAQEFASSGSIAHTFWTRVWLVLPCAGVAAAVMLVWHEPLEAYLGVRTNGIFVILVHFVASFALSTIGAAFQAREQMYRYGAALFLDKAIMAVLLVLTPTVWLTNPLAMLLMYAVSSSAVALWGLIALGRHALLPITFDRRAYSALLAFSFPLGLSSWVGILGTSWFDLIVIEWYLPLADVGLYSLAAMLAGVVQQTTIIFSTLLLPQLSVMVARGEIERIGTIVDRALPYWFLGTSVLFSLVILVAGIVVPLAFSRAFDAAVPAVAVLMVATCALALFNAFSPLVSAFGSTWVLTGVTFVSGLVNLVMDLVLVPRYGIRGAAFATVVTCVTSAILVLAFAQRRLERPLFRLGLLALPVVVTCVCFLLLDGVRFYATAIPSCVIAVYALIRKFRLFRSEDVVVLRNLRLLGTPAPEVSAL